jgi:recombinational DNA repair protein (RecF pathway)
MRPRYSVPAITLARIPHGEASAQILLLTPEFGLVRARAQGIRASGAKLASALQTFVECEAMLVRGKEGWRLAGALLVENRVKDLSPIARGRAGRVAQLLLRLVHGEIRDPELFDIFSAFLTSLKEISETEGDAAETFAVLRILRTLGLDAGEVPGEGFTKEAFKEIEANRSAYIRRVNHGISASGL